MGGVEVVAEPVVVPVPSRTIPAQAQNVPEAVRAAKLCAHEVDVCPLPVLGDAVRVLEKGLTDLGVEDRTPTPPDPTKKNLTL